MDTLELQAEPRQIVKKGVKYLRLQGFVPAVVYGRDVKSNPLKIEARALDRVLEVAGTHQLISLKIGDQKPQMALARGIQRDVIKHNYTHVDFYAVKMDEKVSAQVPLLLIGESVAVINEGGILTQGLDALDIECLPGDLISSIEVDISVLTELNSSLSVSDLELPDTVTVLSDLESLIARVEPPRIIAEDEEDDEESDEDVDAAGMPEVITASSEEE